MKKRLLSLLTTLAMVAGLSAGIFSTGIIEASAAAGGDTEYYGDWAYYVMYDSSGIGTASISAYMGSETSVTIPSKINGITVKYVDSLSPNPDIVTLNTTLKTITIPSTIEYVMHLSYCKNLTTIKVNSSNKYYSASDGVLYNKDKTTLVAYPSGKTASSFTIPSTVTEINYDAFYNCLKLKSITVPKTVKTIGEYAMGYKYTENDLTAKMTKFTIKGYSGTAAAEYADEYGIVFKNLSTSKYVVPTVEKKSSYTCTASAVRINWNKVTGATGYRIYQYNSSTKKWVKIKTVFDNSITTYRVSGLSGATTYKYKVKAFVKSNGSTYWGSASSTITTVTKPSQVKIGTASKSKTAVRLNWSKVTGAKGYMIQRYNSSTKKWENLETISSASTLTYRDEDLKSGTVYKYRIRAYMNVSGEVVCGAWSATKKVTTKS